MKKSFQIFKRDLGRLFRNRAAVLILVGISVLPSLYAWFNIAANMDPYGNTKGIQVAIANEDKGADSEQMSLDAGQNIVDNLKKNDQLGWKFVDAKEAKMRSPRRSQIQVQARSSRRSMTPFLRWRQNPFQSC